MVLRPCLVCGKPARGSRCTEHARPDPGLAVYSDRRWRHLRKRVLLRWRIEHGPWCPGWGVEPHVAFDLTADHIVPIAAGGAPFDERNVGVLCRACNGRKSAR